MNQKQRETLESLFDSASGRVQAQWISEALQDVDAGPRRPWWGHSISIAGAWDALLAFYLEHQGEE